MDFEQIISSVKIGGDPALAGMSLSLDQVLEIRDAMPTNIAGVNKQAQREWFEGLVLLKLSPSDLETYKNFCVESLDAFKVGFNL